METSGDVFLAYASAIAAFITDVRTGGPALLITWLVACHLPSHQSHLGPQGGVSGSLQERLIGPSIYSQSSRDDSDARPRLGITDGAQESGCSWRLGSLPRETAASGTFVGPKLFLCFISFLFGNRVPFFQVKIHKSIAFSPLGKCVWASLQQVSSWHLRPPC